MAGLGVSLSVLLSLSATADVGLSTVPVKVDIGLLGYMGGVTDLNDRGQAVGRHSVNLNFPYHAFFWSQETGIVDLPGLGGEDSYGADINESGLIVGLCTLPDGLDHACAWPTLGEVQDLGLPNVESVALMVNNRGDVLLYEYGDTSRPVLVANSGARTPVETPYGGWGPQITGMNNQGQLVGYELGRAAPWARGFMWSRDGGLVDLEGLGGAHTWGSSINDAGEVAGWASTADNHFHAFIWTSTSGARDIGFLGTGNDSLARRINSQGQIVGSSYFDGAFHAFIWSAEEGMRDLGAVSSNWFAQIWINDYGQVVSSRMWSDGIVHAFTWTAAGGMVDLGPGQAFKVNNSGQVLGSVPAYEECDPQYYCSRTVVWKTDIQAEARLLADAVASMQIQQGVANALSSDLSLLRVALARSESAFACTKLASLRALALAQGGKKLSLTQADYIAASANDMARMLQCP